MTLARTLFTVVSVVAPAQTLIEPGSTDEKRVVKAFDQVLTDTSAPTLDCSIVKYPPRLGFSFRFWSGYELVLPVKQFRMESIGKPLIVVIRATPRGGAPRFFLKKIFLPRFPGDPRNLKKAEIYISGGFSLGSGEYDLLLQAMDDVGRVCRKKWSVEADTPKAPLRIDAGEVTDSFIDTWEGIPQKARTKRVTVFLHTAPVFLRRTQMRLSAWDLTVLLGSLTSLLDTAPFRKARVIAFNLDARRVLFEDSDFGPQGYAKLLDELEKLNLGVVSVDTLRSATPAQILESVIRKEIAQTEKSDAVVFLGPTSRYFDRLSPLLKELHQQLPPTYNIAIFPRLGGVGDLIDRFASEGDGKSIAVYQPGDLAKAIREISENQ